MIKRPILECENIRYTNQTILSPKRVNEQPFFNIPGKLSVISLKDGYIGKTLMKYETIIERNLLQLVI